MSKSHNLFNKLAQAAATTDGSSRKNMAKGTARVPGVAGPVGKKPPAVSGAGKVGAGVGAALGGPVGAAVGAAAGPGMKKGVDKIRDKRDTVDVEKTKGGDYPIYKKDSSSAKNFNKAFRDASAAGKDEIQFRGRDYSTKKAEYVFTKIAKTYTGHPLIDGAIWGAGKIGEGIQAGYDMITGQNKPNPKPKPDPQPSLPPRQHTTTQSPAAQAGAAAAEAGRKKKKDMDTTGGLLTGQGYGDFNKDGKIDVTDAVGARKKINRSGAEINRDKLKERFGIDVNLKGQLKEGSISKAANLYIKLANINPGAATEAGKKKGLMAGAAKALMQDAAKVPAVGISPKQNPKANGIQTGAAENETAHDSTTGGMLAGAKAGAMTGGVAAGRLKRIMQAGNLAADEAMQAAPDRVTQPMGPDNSKNDLLHQ